jgi:hypothetical protein
MPHAINIGCTQNAAVILRRTVCDTFVVTSTMSRMGNRGKRDDIDAEVLADARLVERGLTA